MTVFTAFLNQNGLNDKNYSKIRFSKGIEDACQALKLTRVKWKNQYTKKSHFIISTKGDVKINITVEDDTDPF
jgi:hypothetical protein